MEKEVGDRVFEDLARHWKKEGSNPSAGGRGRVGRGHGRILTTVRLMF